MQSYEFHPTRVYMDIPYGKEKLARGLDKSYLDPELRDAWDPAVEVSRFFPRGCDASELSQQQRDQIDLILSVEGKASLSEIRGLWAAQLDPFRDEIFALLDHNNLKFSDVDPLTSRGFLLRRLEPLLSDVPFSQIVDDFKDDLARGIYDKI